MTTYTVLSGAVSSGITLFTGDEMNVLSGGIARITVVTAVVS